MKTAELRSNQIDPKQIGWVRALLWFPLVRVPSVVAGTLIVALRTGFAYLRRRWRNRDRSPRPPQPLSVVFSSLALVVAFAVFAVIDHATNWRDRVEGMGLILISVATVTVSPELLGLDLLTRLDKWWQESDFPAHQIAFAYYARRIARWLRWGGIILAAAVVAATAFLVLLDRNGWVPKFAHAAVTRSWAVLSWLLLGSLQLSSPGWLAASSSAHLRISRPS